MGNLSDQQKGSLLAFVGVMFITPDSLFIRLSNIDTWGILFYRGAIPSVIILLGLILFYKKDLIKVTLGMGLAGIFYALSFSITNITFIVVANTLVMIATAPMLSAILAAIKENPDKKTWVAILITFLAAVYIFYDSLKIGKLFWRFVWFYYRFRSGYWCKYYKIC